MPQKEETAGETQRLTAHEIFDNARSELRRSWRSLAVSGFAGRITLGLTGIGVASVLATLGEGGWQQLLAYCIHPVVSSVSAVM